MKHGHVTPNADGSKARCGGPGICSECSYEQAQFSATLFSHDHCQVRINDLETLALSWELTARTSGGAFRQQELEIAKLKKRLAVQGCELGSSEAYAEEELIPKLKEQAERLIALQEDGNSMLKMWNAAREENARLREALEELLSCPYNLEEATIPKAGIDAAPEYQVVGTMHVSLTRMQKAREVLKTIQPAELKENYCYCNGQAAHLHRDEAEIAPKAKKDRDPLC